MVLKEYFFKILINYLRSLEKCVLVVKLMFLKFSQKLHVTHKIEDAMKLSELFLDMIGMNVLSEKWYRKQHILLQVYGAGMACLACFGLMSCIICAVYTFADNLEKRLLSILSAAYGAEILLKIMTIFLNQKQLKHLKDQFLEHVEEAKTGMDISYRPMLFKYENWASKALNCLAVIYLGSTIGFIIYPLLLDEEWEYPMNLLLPGTSPNSNPSYTVNYIYVSLCVITRHIFIFGFDLYYILITFYLASRYELCSRYFSQLGNFNGTYNSNEKQAKLLKTAIKVHAKVLNIQKLCCNTMAPVVLVALFAISSMLCILLLLILINPYTHAYIALLAVYGQLIVYCTCGELVATKAFDVSIAIYCSKWYELNEVDERRKVLLALARAQRSDYISIGGRAEFNMEFFAKVTNMIFRFFAFFKNFLH